MISREEQAVRKLQQVIELATGDDCIAYALASYFGDDEAVPNGLCGQCTFCTTGEGISFPSPFSTAITSTTATLTLESVDMLRIQAILRACPERDDPRLLARMAFGITSPRLTAGRWSTSHPLFGSMTHVRFDALVKVFDEECKRVGYTRMHVVQVQGPTANSGARGVGRKRSYTQAEHGGSGYGASYNQTSSRGRANYRGSKRGRYYRN